MKLVYLPKSISSNDFIFSVLAEERGFVGSLRDTASIFKLWAIFFASLLLFTGDNSERLSL